MIRRREDATVWVVRSFRCHFRLTTSAIEWVLCGIKARLLRACRYNAAYIPRSKTDKVKLARLIILHRATHNRFND